MHTLLPQLLCQDAPESHAAVMWQAHVPIFVIMQALLMHAGPPEMADFDLQWTYRQRHTVEHALSKSTT